MVNTQWDHAQAMLQPSIYPSIHQMPIHLVHSSHQFFRARPDRHMPCPAHTSLDSRSTQEHACKLSSEAAQIGVS